MTPPTEQEKPYIGPQPFETGRTLYGRGRETRQLLHLLIAERIVLFYSPSGSGKTSLIQAGLIPLLREEEFLVLPLMRVHDPTVNWRQPATTSEPPKEQNASSSTEKVPLSAASSIPEPANRYVFNALLSLEQALPAEQHVPLVELSRMRFAEYFKRQLEKAIPEVHRLSAEDLARLNFLEYIQQRYQVPADTVLIFDQFEELLTTGDFDEASRSERVDFFEQIGEVLRCRCYWALFSMREEYIAGLDPYLLLVPTRFKTRLRLELLSRENAIDAIRLPDRNPPPFTLKAAQTLAENLSRVYIKIRNEVSSETSPAGDAPSASSGESSKMKPDVRSELGLYVEPVQLQIVCIRLWEQRPQGIQQIDEATVQQSGKIDEALENYYTEKIAAVVQETGIKEQLLRDWFGSHLIIAPGLRNQIPERAAITQGLDSRLLQLLVDSLLIRKEEGRSTWYELTHDRLIEPIQKSNREWHATRQAELSPWQIQAAAWNDKKQPRDKEEFARYLVVGKALTEAESWADEHSAELEEWENLFLEKCRSARTDRRRLGYRKIAAVMLAVAALLVSIWGYQLFLQLRLRQSTILANEVLVNRDTNLELSLLLAREANSEDVTPTTDAQGALLSVVETSPRLRFFMNSTEGHKAPVGCVAYVFYSVTPQIVSGDDEGNLIVWNAATGQKVEEKSQEGPITSMALSPEGKFLVTGNGKGLIVIWDTVTWTHKTPIPFTPREPYLHAAPSVISLAFRGSGTDLSLVAAYDYGSIVSCKIHPNGTTDTLKPEIKIAGIRLLSPSGELLVSDNHEIWEWASNSWKLHLKDQMNSSNSEEDSVQTYVFSPDGKMLAWGGENGGIHIMDCDTLKIRRHHLSGRQTPTSLAFSQDKQTLAVGYQNGSLSLLDVNTNNQIDANLSGHRGEITMLAFSQDNSTLVSASKDFKVILWNASRELENQPHFTTENTWAAVQLSPDQKRLAAAEIDGTMHLWEFSPAQGVNSKRLPPKDLLQPLPIKGRSSDITSLAINWDNSLLAGGDKKSGETLLWDLHTYRSLPSIPAAPDLQMNVLAFSPVKNTLAYSGTDKDKKIAVWLLDLNSSRPQPQILPESPTTSVLAEPNSSLAAALVFSPDGLQLAHDTPDGCLVWNISAPGERPRMFPFKDAVTGLADSRGIAFSYRGGEMLACGRKDGSTILWNTRTEKRLALLAGDSSPVTSVVFSPDNQRLACGHQSGRIIVWTLDKMRPLGKPLSFHQDTVQDLKFELPNGSRLLSASLDKSLHLTDLDLPTLMERVCSMANRNLTREEWNNYIGDGWFDPKYHRICPQLPLPP